MLHDESCKENFIHPLKPDSQKIYDDDDDDELNESMKFVERKSMKRFLDVIKTMFKHSF